MSLTLSSRPSTFAPGPSPPTRKRRRCWPAIAAIAVGTAFLLAAVIWRAAAVPALVKFPTDVDHELRYAGEFVLFVDPATAAALAEPSTATLAVDRHVEALAAESGANDVVVSETVTFEVAGLDAATQVHHYVMDRRTSANVDDGRAWAYERSNVLDRAGAFWIAFPPNIDNASDVPMYKDEMGTTFTAVAGPETEAIEGLQLVDYRATVATAQPLTEEYLRSLDAVVPLPRSLPFDQLKPFLVAAGVPVDEAITAVSTRATPVELATVAELIGEPIPLEYVVTFTGNTFVEPRTGAIVDVASVVDRVGARPAGEAMSALRSILGRYRDDPTIAATIQALDELAAQPLPVFEYRYAQTPASVAQMAEWVSHQRDRIDIAERTVPSALALIGVIFATTGALLLARARIEQRRTDDDDDDFALAA
jgi:hypothetical protein